MQKSQTEPRDSLALVRVNALSIVGAKAKGRGLARKQMTTEMVNQGLEARRRVRSEAGRARTVLENVFTAMEDVGKVICLMIKYI